MILASHFEFSKSCVRFGFGNRKNPKTILVPHRTSLCALRWQCRYSFKIKYLKKIEVILKNIFCKLISFKQGKLIRQINLCSAKFSRIWIHSVFYNFPINTLTLSHSTLCIYLILLYWIISVKVIRSESADKKRVKHYNISNSL